MTTSKHPKQSSRPPIDPLLAQRLQQLGGRRPAGAPLPPPTAGTAQSASRGQTATKQAARPAANSTQARPSGKAQGTTVISTEPPSRRPSSAPVQGANAEQTAKLQAAAARAAAARNAKAGGKAAPAAARKGKPAQSSKIASLAVSVATTAVLAGIFAHNAGSPVAVTLTGGTAAGAGAAGTASNTGSNAGAATPAAGNQNAGATAATPAPAANNGGAAPAPAPAPAAAGGTIKDGTYVGQTEYNRFGPVQVQAVYASGKLTDVQILQYEDGDNRSIRINQIALPRLIQQAVAAGGTNIDGVSGATYTTRSYVKSLQSAIDAAKQASGIAG